MCGSMRIHAWTPYVYAQTHTPYVYLSLHMNEYIRIHTETYIYVEPPGSTVMYPYVPGYGKWIHKHTFVTCVMDCRGFLSINENTQVYIRIHAGYIRIHTYGFGGRVCRVLVLLLLVCTGAQTTYSSLSFPQISENTKICAGLPPRTEPIFRNFLRRRLDLEKFAQGFRRGRSLI
jgi:hypothetical protein